MRWSVGASLKSLSSVGVEIEVAIRSGVGAYVAEESSVDGEKRNEKALTRTQKDV